MIEMDFTPGQKGPEVRIPPPYEDLAWYLSGDLQSSSTTAPVLENVRLVMEGRAEPVEWDGNGYVLIPGPETCRIESLYDESLVIEVPSVDMLSVLERWFEHKRRREAARE